MLFESLDKTRLQRGWGWLTKYVKMEPGFFGFNVRLDKAIEDMLASVKNGGK